MSILFIIVSLLIVVFGLIQLYVKYITKWCKSKVCLVGKTVIVTGGNAGIGYETALELAKRGAKVILACRDVQKGTQAAKSIKKLTENKNVHFKQLNLASFKSIRNFAEDINSTEERIDILINNAGSYGLGDILTEDGIQQEWQINHYGPVLLTLLLLDLLKKSSPSRIVNLSSVAAKFSKLTTDTLYKMNVYEDDRVYCDTKLTNIFFTQKLAEILKNENVSVFSVHPGPVYTRLITQRLSSGYNILFDLFSRTFFLTAEEGAQTNIYTACERGIENLSGKHFEYCRVAEYQIAKNPVLCDKVWEETLKLIKYDKIKLN